MKLFWSLALKVNGDAELAEQLINEVCTDCRRRRCKGCKVNTMQERLLWVLEVIATR
jgi:hypothetical protein